MLANGNVGAGDGRRGVGFVLGLVCAALLVLAATTSAAEEFVAPDPGGDQEAIVPVPPGAKFFGFNDLSPLIPSRGVSAEQIAELASAAGATMHRMLVDWSAVEPRRNQSSAGAWKRYTDFAKALRARGIRPLVQLTHAPTWARDAGYPRLCNVKRGCEYPPSQQMLGEWADYAREVARRIPGAAIEVWNEPNIDNFYRPAPDPEHYARLQRRAFSAIKGVDRSATVLAGGFGNVQRTKGGVIANQETSLRKFLDEAYPLIKNHMDALSIHIHSNEIFRHGKGSLFAQSLFDIRTVRDRHGDHERPIWVTETGISTSGDHAATQQQQARGLVIRYRKLMTMPDIDAMILHTLSDQLDRDPSERAYGFGVLRSVSPLVAKPAFCEFVGRANTSFTLGCNPIKEVAKDRDDALPKRACKRWNRPLAKWRGAGREQRRRILGRCIVRFLTVSNLRRNAPRKINQRAKARCRHSIHRQVRRLQREGRQVPRRKRRRARLRCHGREALKRLKRAEERLRPAASDTAQTGSGAPKG